MELNSVLFPAPKSSYSLSSPFANDLIFIPRDFRLKYELERQWEANDNDDEEFKLEFKCEQAYQTKQVNQVISENANEQGQNIKDDCKQVQNKVQRGRHFKKKSFRSFAEDDTNVQKRQRTISDQEEEKPNNGISQLPQKFLFSHPVSPRSTSPVKEQLKGYIPCLYLSCSQGSSKVLLYFHGNAEDIGIAKELLDYLRSLLRIHVIAVEYPGYGIYPGTPDAHQIIQDAQCVFDYLTLVNKLQPSQIILFGRSIGSGPATYLASQHKVCSLLLLSAFTSIRDLAKDISGKLLQYLITDRFRNIDLITQVKSPTFIVHGMKDTLVPLKHAEELHYKCGGPCALITPADMDHNSFDFMKDLISPFKQFLKQSMIYLGDNNYDKRIELQFDESVRKVPEQFEKCSINSGSFWTWLIRKLQK